MSRHRNRPPRPPEPPEPPGDDYSVGYKRPPRATRWRAGQSGNPRGRPPKEPPDLIREALALIQAMAGATVPASGPYGQIEVQRLQGMIERLWIDAMNDSKNAVAFLKLFATLQGAVSTQAATPAEDDDFAQLERFEQRLADRLARTIDKDDEDASDD